MIFLKKYFLKLYEKKIDYKKSQVQLKKKKTTHQTRKQGQLDLP